MSVEVGGHMPQLEIWLKTWQSGWYSDREDARTFNSASSIIGVRCRVDKKADHSGPSYWLHDGPSFGLGRHFESGVKKYWLPTPLTEGKCPIGNI